MSKNNWANVFIQEPDARAVTLLTDYTMIPREWLGDAFIYEAERLREINPTAYRHGYLGEATGTGGEVFPNLEVREITDAEINNMGYIHQGVDFGFAADPAVFIRVAYDAKRDTIFFLDEIYQRQLSNTQLADLIKEKGYDKIYTYPRGRQPLLITCDSAEPKSITDLRDAGLYAVSCYKCQGCVEYRIKWLQHRKIVIDPRALDGLIYRRNGISA